MDPTIIAAGIGAIGSLLGGGISSSGQNAANQSNLQAVRETNQFNAAEAQKNREFQERLSSTAYQRAMADMRTAGLNPILAYQQGGSSTPSGATASGTAARFENAMEGLGQGATSAGAMAGRAIELQQVRAQTEAQNSQAEVNKATVGLTAANTARAAQETATSAANMRKADADAALTTEMIKNPAAQRMLFGAQAHSARAAGDFSDEQRKQLNQYGPHWTGQVAGSIMRALQTLRGANPTSPPSTLTAPGLPSWLSSDNPVVQERIRRQRERNN